MKKVLKKKHKFYILLEVDKVFIFFYCIFTHSNHISGLEYSAVDTDWLLNLFMLESCDNDHDVESIILTSFVVF